jgi:muconolactone delta-isomerase
MRPRRSKASIYAAAIWIVTKVGRPGRPKLPSLSDMWISLQGDGRWRDLWRLAGRSASVSVFDVSSTDELDGLISGLPHFPYLDVRVTPLALHPSVWTARGSAELAVPAD